MLLLNKMYKNQLLLLREKINYYINTLLNLLTMNENFFAKFLII